MRARDRAACPAPPAIAPSAHIGAIARAASACVTEFAPCPLVQPSACVAHIRHRVIARLAHVRSRSHALHMCATYRATCPLAPPIARLVHRCHRSRALPAGASEWARPAYWYVPAPCAPAIACVAEWHRQERAPPVLSIRANERAPPPIHPTPIAPPRTYTPPPPPPTSPATPTHPAHTPRYTTPLAPSRAPCSLAPLSARLAHVSPSSGHAVRWRCP